MEQRDRDELTDLVGRLGLWLDGKRFDEPLTVFTEDAQVTTRGGTSRCAEVLAAQARRNHTVPTQHFVTNPLVEVDGDRAAIGANLVVVFAEDGGPRVLGERFVLGAARTPAGWRLSSVRVRTIWEMPAA
jgi:hypothetical protein